MRRRPAPASPGTGGAGRRSRPRRRPRRSARRRAGVGDGAPEPQHPAQHRGPVPERGEAAAVQGARGPAQSVGRGPSRMRLRRAGWRPRGTACSAGSPGSDSSEAEEHRTGPLALFEARERPAGRAWGAGRPAAPAGRAARAAGRPSSAGSRPGAKRRPALRTPGSPAGRVRAGVGPGDEQLRAGPDQVHAAVGQHLERFGGAAGGDARRPGALDLAAQRPRRRDLPVAHVRNGSPDL